MIRDAVCLRVKSCNAPDMRSISLCFIGLVGCATVSAPPTAQYSTPSRSANPSSKAIVGAAGAPVAAVEAGPPEISADARARAREAFRQALELWSAARTSDAHAMVALGLAALVRQLPRDAVAQQIGALEESASFSEDGGTYAVSDRETLSVLEAGSGRLLGLRVHEYKKSLESPALSPKGTFVVAPSGTELIVYESRGLAVRSRISARHDAPFAFLSETRLITVRLGAPASGTFASRGQFLLRSAPESSRAPDATAESEEEFSDDEIVVIDLLSGKTEQTFKLVAPPDQGLLRRVASLPPSQRCNDVDECQRFELNPVPIGRRVEEFKISAGLLVSSWRGGATTFHRLRDGKLLGAFRSRGERWKPGLVALWPKPPRAAVVTSLPEVGRGNEPPFSVTALFDLTQGKVLELIDECRWATGVAFSDDGTRLMVGDLRRACLHDGRTGRFLHATDEVRPPRGSHDDLQDVSVRSVPEGRWLLTTLDGSFGIIDGQSGRAIYLGSNDGRRGLVASDERALYVADFTGGAAQLITFGPAGLARRLMRSEELEQRVVPPEFASSPEGRRRLLLERLLHDSCVVEGFRLPIELCSGAEH